MERPWRRGTDRPTIVVLDGTLATLGNRLELLSDTSARNRVELDSNDSIITRKDSKQR